MSKTLDTVIKLKRGEEEKIKEAGLLLGEPAFSTDTEKLFVGGKDGIVEIETDLSGYATTASVPTKTSDLTNDSGFITQAAVPTKVSELSNDTGFITSSSLPTKTSDLTNDSDFAVTSAIPTKISDLTNDAGFITATEAEPEIFIAKHGETTAEELSAAYEAGKAIFCTYQQAGTSTQEFYTLNTKIGEVYYFERLYDGDQVHRFRLQNGSWTAPTIAALARRDSPSFRGTPTAPTASAGTNTTQIATTAFVKTAIENAAPEPDVFVAKYGVTTNAEIEAAYQAGKHIYAMDSMTGAGETEMQVFYSLYFRYSATHHRFAGNVSESGSVVFSDVENNTWARQALELAFRTSPAFTGTPTAPTAAAGTNTTQIATTAFVQSALPTKTSDLTNDSSFAITSDIPMKTSDLTNDSGFITSSSLPTKTSDLTNDSGYITSAAVPTKVSDLTNDSGFITQEYYYDNLPTDLSDFNNGPGFVTRSDIPTKTSDLTNDSGFITASAFESPSFTGTPTAPTASSGTSTTQLATTAFVQTAVAAASDKSAFLATYGVTTGAEIAAAYDAGKAIVCNDPENSRTYYYGGLKNDIENLSVERYFYSFEREEGSYGETNTKSTDLKCLKLVSSEDGESNYWSRLSYNLNSSATAFDETSPTNHRTTLSVDGIDVALADSPAFTGVPTAPTAASGTNTTQIATTAFVQDAVSNVSGGGHGSALIPDFDGEPIESHEFTVTVNNVPYYILTHPNIDDYKSLFGKYAAFRCTVKDASTGAVGSVTDVIYRPMMGGNNPTKPVSGWISGNNWPSSEMQSLYNFNTAWPNAIGTTAVYAVSCSFANISIGPATVKIDVFRTFDGVTWMDTATRSIPSGSSGTGTASIQYTKGLFNSNPEGYAYTAHTANSATTANSASQVTGYSNKYLPSVNLGMVGETTTTNNFMFTADGENYSYPHTNTEKAINCDNGLIYYSWGSNTTLSKGANLISNYKRIKAPNITLQEAINGHETGKADQPVYLRCQLKDGKVYSTGIITTTVAPGYTYYYLGVTGTNSSTLLVLDCGNKDFITLGSDGKITHINGREIGGSSGDSESVFVAIRNVTKHSELEAAYKARKTILAKQSSASTAKFYYLEMAPETSGNAPDQHEFEFRRLFSGTYLGSNKTVKTLTMGLRYISGDGDEAEDSAYEWELDDIVTSAPVESPTFSGKPTAPTPDSGDNSARIATTAFVQQELELADFTRMTPIRTIKWTHDSSIVTSTNYAAIFQRDSDDSIEELSVLKPIVFRVTMVDQNNHFKSTLFYYKPWEYAYAPEIFFETRGSASVPYNFRLQYPSSLANSELNGGGAKYGFGMYMNSTNAYEYIIDIFQTDDRTTFYDKETLLISSPSGTSNYNFSVPTYTTTVGRSSINSMYAQYAVTQSEGTNNTRIATTSFVNNVVYMNACRHSSFSSSTPTITLGLDSSPTSPNPTYPWRALCPNKLDSLSLIIRNNGGSIFREGIVIFRVGSDDFEFTLTAVQPNNTKGAMIIWDSEPTFVNGHIYELSFRGLAPIDSNGYSGTMHPDSDNYTGLILATYKEYEIPESTS